MFRVRITPFALWIATSHAACQVEERGAAKASPTAPRPSIAPEAWHYAPALKAGTPADLAVAPVFELADGRRGVAQIAVAVVRGGDPPRLEVWDFDQNNPRERLERVGEPRELLALKGIGGGEVLAAIHRQIAQPGNEYVRPLGLPGPPEMLFHELVRLAAELRDPGGRPQARAEALARVTFALDDHLLFERKLLPALLEALASGDWSVAEHEPVGERRMKVVLRGPPHRFVLARTGERWVLSEATLSQSSAPAAEPSPTAP